MSLGKFLTVDPGEDTGWSIWEGPELLDAGTTKMWEFSDIVWDAALRLAFPDITMTLKEVPQFLSDPDDVAYLLEGIQFVVVEDWRLYPWVLRTGSLDFDECRTARLIGSIFAACRLTGWPFEAQPAAIKERALAAGAETYFSHPLHENRHANDAIMHGVYRNALEHGAPWTNLGIAEQAPPSAP